MKRILVGVPPRNHVLLSYDEKNGLTEQGYLCKSVLYGRNDNNIGKLNKLVGVFARAFNIIKALYSFKPHILYLNSRFEFAGSTRDFITVLLVRLLYWRRLKVIIKTHGSEPSLLQSRSFFYRRLVVPFLSKQVDAWFFLSRDEKQIIQQYRPDMANKVFVTANIIDPERSVASKEFKRKYDLPNDKFTVLYVGRITKEKGVFDMLKSIPLLNKKEDCLFVFVGDGPDLEALKTMAVKMGLSNHTRFTGFVPDAECDHFYANADLLAFPTYANEGFPMALFKSVAVGLPVITTRIRAAKDHLSAPDNVLWVEKESPESIAKAIDTLHANPRMRMTMGNNNRRKGKDFSRQAVCAGMSRVMNYLFNPNSTVYDDHQTTQTSQRPVPAKSSVQEI